MPSTAVKFNISKIIVTYDLSPNDISAQEIADASNGMFHTTITTQNLQSFTLPNTTLESDKTLSAGQAAIVFKQALMAAKLKKGFSLASITRLLCYEVAFKGGYIENN